MTGLDRTADFLDQARRGADAESLNIDFVQADMRRFCALEEFDAVVNLYTSFGYFEDPCDDKRVLLNACASLKRGGKLLLDLVSKEVLAREFQRRNWRQCNDRILLQEAQASEDWSWINNRWILLENGQRKEFTFGHRVYSAVELTSLLKRCGFAETKVFGNLAGAPYDQEAQRLVIVAVK